jgi:hypothetical protein
MGNVGRRFKRPRKAARSGGRLSLQRDSISRIWTFDVMPCIEILNSPTWPSISSDTASGMNRSGSSE